MKLSTIIIVLSLTVGVNLCKAQIYKEVQMKSDYVKFEDVKGNIETYKIPNYIHLTYLGDGKIRVAVYDKENLLETQDWGIFYYEQRVRGNHYLYKSSNHEGIKVAIVRDGGVYTIEYVAILEYAPSMRGYNLMSYKISNYKF